MKRAVVTGESEEGYRSLIVVDATQPHLSIRDVIDAALIGEAIGDNVKVETFDVPDDVPGHCTPQAVDEAAAAIFAAHRLVDDGDNVQALGALESAMEHLGRQAP